MQTILTLKDELAGMLHGTNIDDVYYPLGVFYRAGREILQDSDPFETKRLAPLTTPLYQGIFSYAAPLDLKMNGIIDLRPQVNRIPGDVVDNRFSRQFDQYKQNDTITVEYQNGIKLLRVSKLLNSPVSFGNFSSTQGWTTGDDADNLTTNTVYYTYPSSSLQFDLDGSTTAGYLENSTIQETNLSQHANVSRLFLDVFFQNASAITSVTLRWGNDSSNYYSSTATSPFDQSSFTNGWNTLGFNWVTATEVGTVDPSTISYVRITVTYDGVPQNDLFVDNLRSILGFIYNVQYYSNFIYQDAITGVLKEKPESDDDLVILEPQSINLYLKKVAEFAAQQAQQQGQSVDISYFSSEYQKSLKNYNSLYPSEKIQPKSFYYNIRRPTNGRGVNTY